MERKQINDTETLTVRNCYYLWVQGIREKGWVLDSGSVGEAPRTVVLGPLSGRHCPVAAGTLDGAQDTGGVRIPEKKRKLEQIG